MFSSVSCALVAMLGAAGTACGSGDDVDSADGANGSGGANTGGTSAGGAGVGTGGVVDTSPAHTRPGTTIVHLFEWKWPDIARECEVFLGPRGFDAVQVSPPTDHAVLAGSAYPWWQRYQPAGYGLTSRSGSPDEFDDMVARCRAAGVDIYVDAVINHMTAQDSGTNSAGDAFTKYEYAGLYSAADFHDPPCGIEGTDYATNADDVRNCELVGLSDLKTEDDSVRDRIAALLVDYVERGVRGFRIDAAKHMPPADIRAVLERVREAVGAEKMPYFFLEVIDNGAEAIQATEYLEVAGASGAVVDVTEFKYAGVGEKFRGFERVSDLAAFSEEAWSLLPADRAISFITNHDTQRQTALYYADGVRAELANVYLLAHPYGVPQLLSGYAFNRATSLGPSAGPPSDSAGNTNSIFAPGSDVPSCATNPSAAVYGEWVCEHRQASIYAMVGFRSATHGAAVTNVWDDDGQRLAFGREGAGFVVFNLEDTTFDHTFTTDLPAGRYCNVLDPATEAPDCGGRAVTVGEGGELTLSVAPLSAQAFHVGARP